jgi:hypothetical protein
MHIPHAERTRRLPAMLAVLVMAVILTGCSARVGPQAGSSGAPSEPASDPAPSRTLNPNELARASQSRPPTPSARSTPTPVPVTTPRASPTPAAPELEALLPSVVAGVRYDRMSFILAVEQDLAGGDMCGLFCPGEIRAFATRLGITSGPGRVAFAVPADGHAAGIVLVRAIRLDGAVGRAHGVLEQAWADHGVARADGFPITDRLSLGGKSILLVIASPFPTALSTSWVYAHDGTLFVVNLEPTPDDPSRPGTVLTEVISGLP